MDIVTRVSGRHLRDAFIALLTGNVAKYVPEDGQISVDGEICRESSPHEYIYSEA